MSLLALSLLCACSVCALRAFCSLHRAVALHMLGPVSQDYTLRPWLKSSKKRKFPRGRSACSALPSSLQPLGCVFPELHTLSLEKGFPLGVLTSGVSESEEPGNSFRIWLVTRHGGNTFCAWNPFIVSALAGDLAPIALPFSFAEMHQSEISLKCQPGLCFAFLNGFLLCILQPGISQ